MTRAPGALTAGLLALALAGCANASGPGGSQALRADVAPVRTVAVSVATWPSEADGNPDRLRSLDPEAVTRLIGVPSYIRRDGTVTIWQYHAGGCVMDLFWYPSAVGPRLTHYEVRGVRLASSAEPRACFGDLLVRRRDTAATS
ncbi:MAG TPA: hypothetical protein VIR38_12015 [Thalassobaculum sp.]